MFISIKRKVSSTRTLINTIILAILILVSHLTKQVVVVLLYQQYHMADRLGAYMGELEEVITCIDDMLQIGVVGLFSCSASCRGQ